MSIELVPDELGGVTVMRDGQPQSHVDLRDPEGLVFEYVQHIAAVVDAMHPAPAPLAVTHVGGGGLTLPRWVHATRPGSPQIVLEPDEALTALVRAQLPLPRGHRIRVRPVDGRTGVAALRGGSAQVVVVDAFDAGRVPADLQTTGFFADVARVLAPGGVVVMNAPDEPGLAHVGRVAAGLRAALGPVALVATRDIVKGRRYGNCILVAAKGELRLDEFRRQAARWPFPSGVLSPTELERRTAGARPIEDGDEVDAPVAPDLGQWRVR